MLIEVKNTARRTTMEEPRPRVICLESDPHRTPFRTLTSAAYKESIRLTFDSHNITSRWVQVIHWARVALNDIEGMTVQARE